MRKDGTAHIAQVSLPDDSPAGGLTKICSWSLEGPTYPRFARKTLDLKTINKAPLKHAHDDEVSILTI